MVRNTCSRHKGKGTSYYFEGEILSYQLEALREKRFKLASENGTVFGI
jgi:hypothetical protein